MIINGIRLIFLGHVVFSFSFDERESILFCIPFFIDRWRVCVNARKESDFGEVSVGLPEEKIALGESVTLNHKAL